MTASANFTETARARLAEAAANGLDYAPALAGALLVVLVGWLLAGPVRAAARRTLSGLGRLVERGVGSTTLSRARLPAATAPVLGELAYWAVIVITITIAARIARLPALAGWLDQIVRYLPNLLLGGLILALGYLLGLVVGEQVERAARTARSGQGALLGRLAQGAIVLSAVIMALDQVGIDVGFLVTLFAILAGALALSLSLAFALGARDHVASLVAARSLRRSLAPGCRLRVGDSEGVLLEVTATQIALETAEGRALIPAARAETDGLVVLADDGSGED
ncbi:mechanosensitive ion channel family protein [Maricaulis sp. CAU 1757]